jgi:hypothetical protein
VGAYIGVGEPPARWAGGMPLRTVQGNLPPVGRAGCPRGRVRASSRIKKFLIREEALERGLDKYLAPPARWMGGRCPDPFFEIFQIGTSFSNLIFLTFFKNNSYLCLVSWLRRSLITGLRQRACTQGLAKNSGLEYVCQNWYLYNLICAEILGVSHLVAEATPLVATGGSRITVLPSRYPRLWRVELSGWGTGHRRT